VCVTLHRRPRTSIRDSAGDLIHRSPFLGSCQINESQIAPDPPSGRVASFPSGVAAVPLLPEVSFHLPVASLPSVTNLPLSTLRYYLWARFLVPLLSTISLYSGGIGFLLVTLSVRYPFPWSVLLPRDFSPLDHRFVWPSIGYFQSRGLLNRLSFYRIFSVP
jgi:hypothetical protein